MGTETLLFFSLFARTLGFFTLSPLFRWHFFPSYLRFALAFFTALFLVPSFLSHPVEMPSSFFLFNLLKEISVGYLLGFLFSLLFEGVALSGEVVGSLMGLSLTEVFDPVSNTSNPLMSRLFALIVALLFFSLDLHHSLIRTLLHSFEILPLAPFPWNAPTLEGILSGFTLLFSQLFQFALIPLYFLLIVLAFLALVARVFPDFPLFWMGFPLQLGVGLIALVVAMGSFPEKVMKSFYQFHQLVEQILVDLAK